MEPYGESTIEEPVATNSKRTLAVILGRLVTSALSWMIHCLVSAGLFLIFVKLVPLARDQYEAFGLDLPVISELVLNWSNGLINYWYLLVLAHIFIDAPIAIGVCYLPRRFQWVTWVWFTSYLLLAILLLVIACIGLTLPFVDITTELS